MRLLSLSLKNFGPFFGLHNLPLDVTGASPVVLVHGENMRGKTSLLRALRWCLYGSIAGRGPGGGDKSTYRLISYDALSQDDFHMSVTLEFEHDGQQYELERHVQSQKRPTRDQDLEAKISLRRAGHFVAAQEISQIIGTILHPDISRFFLFDGEMLDQYEVLLSDPNRDSDLVKTSIEQILGLPALQNSVDDLTRLRRAADQRQLKTVQESKHAEQIVAQIQQVENEVQSIERDLDELKAISSDLNDRRGKLEEQRESFAEIQADLRDIEQSETSVKSLVEDTETLTSEIKQIVSNAWWAPVAQRANKTLQSLTVVAQQSAERRSRLQSLREDLQHLEEILNGRPCPTCGEVPTSNVKKAAIQRREDILQEVKSSSEPGDSDVGLVGQIRDLQEFSDLSHVRVIREKETTLRKTEIQIRKVQKEIDRIRNRLQGHDRGAIRAVEDQYVDVLHQIKEADDKLAARSANLQERRVELARRQQELQRLPDADPAIAGESEIYSVIHQTFEAAVTVFRERVRKEVAEEATEIFRELTTEPEYERLEINQRYGLEIIDSSGMDIKDRSAGAEQIVAMSLIGALNRNAVREGPLVMDTPFGRLDVNHRENILKFLPSFPQVVLLVQSGELDLIRDLVHLDGKIGRQFRLERDGAPTRSRIERLD